MSLEKVTFTSLTEVMHHAADMRKSILDADKAWRECVETYKKTPGAEIAYDLMKFRTKLDELTFGFQDLVRQLTGRDMRAPINSYDVAEIVWRLQGGKDRTAADRGEGTGDAETVAEQPVSDGLVPPA